MWKCKNCGSIVKVSVEHTISRDFNIGKDQEPIGECLKKYAEEYERTSFYCPCCENQSDFLKDIAYWEEE